MSRSPGRPWPTWRSAGVLLACLAIAACAEKPEEPRLDLAPARFADLPGWADDRHAEALPALRRSCGRLLRIDPSRPIGPDGIGGTAADWREPCSALATVPDGDDAAARSWAERWLRPYRASDRGEAEGLFTGYYEPELAGSRMRSDRYGVPLYRRPRDLVTIDLGEFRDSLKGQRLAGRVVDGRLVPYEPRAAIADGALGRRGEPIAWVEDEVDAFFLHIQGSGRIRLAEGGIMRVGYAAQNGHPYYAIGRELVARGALAKEEVTLQSIRVWLRANPGEIRGVLDRNPSYVFFRELVGEGPLGAEGVALTPGRSLAVDRKFLPLSTPVWLSAAHPDGGRLARLMVAQDTGGAITGPVRGDVFWGAGAEAERLAGMMKAKGGYWLLLPRQPGKPGV